MNKKEKIQASLSGSRVVLRHHKGNLWRIKKSGMDGFEYLQEFTENADGHMVAGDRVHFITASKVESRSSWFVMVGEDKYLYGEAVGLAAAREIQRRVARKLGDSWSVSTTSAVNGKAHWKVGQLS